MFEQAPKSKSYELSGLSREDISLLYDKANEVIDKNSYNETEFEDVYGVESIKRDQALVAREKEKIIERGTGATQVATILEALILENGELSEWFGPNAFTTATSEFDDLVNGVDMIIEFREGRTASYLGLAADVTFSSNPDSSQGVSKKMLRLMEKVKAGKLPRVKYFESRHIHFKGTLKNLPEVIIGLDKKTVFELAELWQAKQKKMLGQHPAQIMILEQIIAQARFFAELARSSGGENTEEVATLYSGRAEVLERILAEKKIALGNIKDTRRDQLHEQIMNFVKR